MQKISPFLWFDTQAEEAMNFYVSVFKNAKAGKVTRYPMDITGPAEALAGKVMTASFELEGMQFTALNASPAFKFSEAISFVINCDGQEEVDYYWDKLTADGGQESDCGWLKDKFGLSWQVTPKQMGEIVGGPDPVKAGRAMAAMMTMKKLDVAKLQAAYDGE